MASSTERCSMCPKGAGICFCTGCKQYFCRKDFNNHRDSLSNDLDGFIQKRNILQEKISKSTTGTNVQSPLILQIDAWQNATIEKINKIADQTRAEIIQQWKSQQTELKTKFDELSNQLVQLKESDDFVETDLKNLTKKMTRLEQDLTQAAQSSSIELNMDQSNSVPWDTLISIVNKARYHRESQQRSQFIGKFLE